MVAFLCACLRHQWLQCPTHPVPTPCSALVSAPGRSPAGTCCKVITTNSHTCLWGGSSSYLVGNISQQMQSLQPVCSCNAGHEECSPGCVADGMQHNMMGQKRTTRDRSNMCLVKTPTTQGTATDPQRHILSQVSESEWRSDTSCTFASKLCRGRVLRLASPEPFWCRPPEKQKATGALAR